MSLLLITPSQSVAFHIQIPLPSSNDGSQGLPNIVASQETTTALYHDQFKLTITCLVAGESQGRSCTISYSNLNKWHHISPGLQCISAFEDDQLLFGDIEVNLILTDELFHTTINEPRKGIFQRAMRKFRRRAHHFTLLDENSLTHQIAKPSKSARYAIFEQCEIYFQNIEEPKDSMRGCFVVNGGSTIQKGKHVFQFERELNKSRSPESSRQASQFEVFLSVFDDKRDKISWMLHTSTAGEKLRTKRLSSQAVWAIHPRLPLLAWLLPGHQLRISYIDSQAPPIMIAAALTIESDSTQAIKFCSNGRYMMVQGRETFKCGFMMVDTLKATRSVVLCDLAEGKSASITLSSTSSLSFDLDDQYLHTYRLTRNCAIERSLYSLPALVLCERQYLTFIPAHCSCQTCGVAFDSFEKPCSISIIEHEGMKSVVLGHSALNVGRAIVDGKVCEPLILRITCPPLQVDLKYTGEATLDSTSVFLFPKIIDSKGTVIKRSFDSLQLSCCKELEAETPGCQCSSCIVCHDESPAENGSRSRRILQMKTTIWDFPDPKQEIVSPDQVEGLLAQIESLAENELRVTDDWKKANKDSASKMKMIFGDDIFPWDSWKDFKATLDEMENDYSFKQCLQDMFEDRGIGCRIPLSIQTFCFDKTDENTFTWSSAIGLGWIEEDLDWFYERFLDSDFDGARTLYEFPGYQTLKEKSDELSADKTAKGERHRRFFGNYTTESDTGKAQPTLPSSSKDRGTNKPEPGSIEDIFDDVKSVLPMVAVKDFCTAFSEFVPGMGEMMEQRLHNILQKSMIVAEK